MPHQMADKHCADPGTITIQSEGVNTIHVVPRPLADYVNARIAELEAENARLRGIVERLQSTTGRTNDDEIIIPGVTYWCVCQPDLDDDYKFVSECQFIGHAEPWTDGLKWEVKRCESIDGVSVLSVWSTPHAAEAARSKP